MNIVKGSKTMEKINFENINLDISNHLSKLKNKDYYFGLRASEIKLDNEGQEFEVELAEISGSETLLHLKRGNTKVISLIEEVMNFKTHEKVKIKFNEKKFYAFDENEQLVSSPYGVFNG